MSTKKKQEMNLKDKDDFWGILQSDIITSEHGSSFYDDTFAYGEQNAMFSLFFRGFSQLELIHFQNFFQLKDKGYLILIEFLPGEDSNTETLELKSLDCYRFIRRTLSDRSHFAIGHLISNRISILITGDSGADPDIIKQDSLAIAKKLIKEIQNEFDINAIAGIGNVYSSHSVFSSFVEALSCLAYCKDNEAKHIIDISEKNQDIRIDYDDAVRHMKEAIIHKRPSGYDYFCILMKQIQPLNDNAKRNKIFELLTMTAISVQTTGEIAAKNIDYIELLKEISQLSGDALIEWAFKSFISITGYIKPKKTIDYSNNIVKITQEFLESHYSEDITLEDVAKQVNISPQYFSKLIKKSTGFNFTEWLSMLRVKKAKELLTDTNLTVKEVCYKVGYKDPNYFSRIFKKKMGLTPSEYVKTRSYHIPKT